MPGFRCGSEPVVQAGAHEMRAEVDVAGRKAAAAGDVAEIDIEVLELGGPVAGERAFDTRADGPSDVGLARAPDAGLRRLHFAERNAAGHVRHPAVKRPAEAAAAGAEPGVLDFASGRAERVGEVALDAGPG